DGLLAATSRRVNRVVDGSVEWSVRTKQYIDSIGVVGDRVVVLQQKDRERRKPGKITVMRDGTVEWERELSVGVAGGQARDGDSFVVTEGDGTVWRYDATGTLEWKTQLDSPCNTSPLVAHGGVFVVDTQDTAYRLDRATGETTWTTAVAGASRGTTPSIRESNLLVGGTDQLYSLDATTGEQRWTFDTGRRPSTAEIGRRNCFVCSGAGDLSAVTLADGRERWTATLPDRTVIRNGRGGTYAGINGQPIKIGRSVFVQTQGGQLLTLSTQGGRQ
ncbi:MAG: PQQ-binding-like beta-propeller repeat protein, partial [Halobaculum sp.]